MRITQVTYGRKFSANYQSETIELTATVGEDDDPREVAYRLKSQVLQMGGESMGAARAEHIADGIALAREEIESNVWEGVSDDEPTTERPAL